MKILLIFLIYFLILCSSCEKNCGMCDTRSYQQKNGMNQFEYANGTYEYCGSEFKEDSTYYYFNDKRGSGYDLIIKTNCR